MKPNSQGMDADDNDYDGHKVLRGCVYGLPFALLLWFVIMLALGWFISG